jgi:hypothetical protein
MEQSELVIDTITDLLQSCDVLAIDFYDALRVAEGHFYFEQSQLSPKAV